MFFFLKNEIKVDQITVNLTVVSIVQCRCKGAGTSMPPASRIFVASATVPDPPAVFDMAILVSFRGRVAPSHFRTRPTSVVVFLTCIFATYYFIVSSPWILVEVSSDKGW